MKIQQTFIRRWPTLSDIETIIPAEDEDYAKTHVFEFGEPNTCVIKELWVDANRNIFLRSNDSQLICVPKEIRKLIAARIKEATFE
jgi:hypothetical protein